MTLRALSIATEGLVGEQGFHLPFDRFVTIRGSLRDLLGQPLPGRKIRATTYRRPVFNEQDLVAIDAVEVLTDADGGISTNPNNRLRILRSTDEDELIARVQVVDAGAEWIVRVPSNTNLVRLKDLVTVYLVQDLSLTGRRLP